MAQDTNILYLYLTIAACQCIIIANRRCYMAKEKRIGSDCPYYKGCMAYRYEGGNWYCEHECPVNNSDEDEDEKSSSVPNTTKLVSNSVASGKTPLSTDKDVSQKGIYPVKPGDVKPTNDRAIALAHKLLNDSIIWPFHIGIIHSQDKSKPGAIYTNFMAEYDAQLGEILNKERASSPDYPTEADSQEFRNIVFNLHKELAAKHPRMAFCPESKDSPYAFTESEMYKRRMYEVIHEKFGATSDKSRVPKAFLEPNGIDNKSFTLYDIYDRDCFSTMDGGDHTVPYMYDNFPIIYHNALFAKFMTRAVISCIVDERVKEKDDFKVFTKERKKILNNVSVMSEIKNMAEDIAKAALAKNIVEDKERSFKSALTDFIAKYGATPKTLERRK